MALKGLNKNWEIWKKGSIWVCILVGYFYGTDIPLRRTNLDRNN